MSARKPPTPDDATLHEAALTHLARYAATEIGLRRVLDRRIARWVRAATEAGADTAHIVATAATARAAAKTIAARLVAAGAVNDATFAASRARRMARAGRSARAVLASLAAKGVTSETARAALPENPEAELAAALILTRKRRLGAFAATPAEEDSPAHLAALGVLARAGFARAVAETALSMPRAEAEAAIKQATEN